MDSAVEAPPRCRSCGGTTAIGRDRRGRRVAVCAECGRRHVLEVARRPVTIERPWWAD